MTGGRPGQDVFDLQRSAALLGAYCALERRLFELTGAWAADPGADPSLRVPLDAWSAEHAWHAELWADRLPVLSVVDAQALVELPGPLAEVLGELEAATPIGRLAGLARVVLPRLVTSYARHLEVSPVASEAPVRRALRLVLSDETEAWAAGEALLEARLTSPEQVGEAGSAVVSLESGLVGAGIGPGLVLWPDPRA